MELPTEESSGATTQPQRAITNEPDSPLSSIPSQVSSPGSRAADGGGVSDDEQMPRVRASSVELQRRVDEQVQ